MAGSLQTWPLSDLAKIYRPLEWSHIGSRAPQVIEGLFVEGLTLGARM